MAHRRATEYVAERDHGRGTALTTGQSVSSSPLTANYTAPLCSSVVLVYNKSVLSVPSFVLR